MAEQPRIDVVVSYVNGDEPVWQSALAKYDILPLTSRYRDWGTLKYWFRGISQNLPFVRRVHLLVSNIEQVPDWVNRDTVNVVLHKDFIPEKYLPTFNSTTIEMFIPFIPGLSERFVYFNDDMFAINSTNELDFFNGDTPVYSLKYRNNVKNIFRCQARNSYEMAKSITDFHPKKEGIHYFHIVHGPAPISNKDALELWDSIGDRIENSLTKFREPWNFNQYLFSDYSIMKGHWMKSKSKLEYLEMNEFDLVLDAIANTSCSFLCINDASIEDFELKKDELASAFQARFPTVSKYEC